MPNIFSQPGPLTRTVRDAAILLQVLAGFDRRDQASIRQTPPDFMAATERGIDGLRIGWSADFGFAPVFPEVVDVTYKAAMVFEEMGCAVEEVNMVLPEPYDSLGPMQSAGAYDGLAQYLDEYGDRMTEFARFFIEMGSRVTPGDYMRAEGRLAELKATFDDAFETYDLIMSPVTSFPAFPNETFPGSITGDSSYPIQYWNGAFTMHGNAIGHPGRVRPRGLLTRRPAHRPPDNRPQVRRGDRPRRIRRLRASPPVDPAQAAGVLRRMLPPSISPLPWERLLGCYLSISITPL